MSRITRRDHQSWESPLPAMREGRESVCDLRRVRGSRWSMLLLVAGLACCLAAPAISHAKYIKAVTYFGNAWPLN